jgi:hypothetical protein
MNLDEMTTSKWSKAMKAIKARKAPGAYARSKVPSLVSILQKKAQKANRAAKFAKAAKEKPHLKHAITWAQKGRSHLGKLKKAAGSIKRAPLTSIIKASIDDTIANGTSIQEAVDALIDS